MTGIDRNESIDAGSVRDAKLKPTLLPNLLQDMAKGGPRAGKPPPTWIASELTFVFLLQLLIALASKTSGLIRILVGPLD